MVLMDACGYPMMSWRVRARIGHGTRHGSFRLATTTTSSGASHPALPEPEPASILSPPAAAAAAAATATAAATALHCIAIYRHSRIQARTHRPPLFRRSPPSSWSCCRARLPAPPISLAQPPVARFPAPIPRTALGAYSLNYPPGFCLPPHQTPLPDRTQPWPTSRRVGN